LQSNGGQLKPRIILSIFLKRKPIEFNRLYLLLVISMIFKINYETVFNQLWKSEKKLKIAKSWKGKTVLVWGSTERFLFFEFRKVKNCYDRQSTFKPNIVLQFHSHANNLLALFNIFITCDCNSLFFLQKKCFFKDPQRHSERLLSS